MTDTDTTTTITIDDVEQLAERLETEETGRRAKLRRLIRSYARILAVREPKLFVRRATEYSDEDGHWDSSYPPKQVYKDRTGPRTIEVDGYTWEEIATSSGYYYEWRASAGEPGVYVDREGTIWGAAVTGTGRLGPYAAHPGNCDVMLTIEWLRRSDDDVTTAELHAAERALRKLAFPASAAA